VYSFRLKRQCWKFKNYQLDTGVPIGKHVAATPVERARHLGESVLLQTKWSTRRTDVLDDGLDFLGKELVDPESTEEVPESTPHETYHRFLVRV
jgi:hypothetical protein